MVLITGVGILKLVAEIPNRLNTEYRKYSMRIPLRLGGQLVVTFYCVLCISDLTKNLYPVP
jgi:hypothetical protein